MPKLSLRLIHCLLWALICCGACSIVQAQTYKYSILYAFKNNGTDPNYLVAPLIVDSTGNLYGTSVWGGNSNLGTVFEISKTGRLTTLYDFLGTTDGAYPLAAVVRDSKGNLYGTADGGGSSVGNCFDFGGCGTIFKLTPAGKETVLYTFDGNQGLPASSVVLDGAGNLYGTVPTSIGATGPTGPGAVYELAANGTFNLLYQFCSLSNCADGNFGQQGGSNDVVRDSAGNLYGETEWGGTSDLGVVYKLAPGGAESVLYNFTGPLDGNGPAGSDLIRDSQGNLYGVAGAGLGVAAGMVFKVSPAGEETPLYTFCSLSNCADGEYPNAQLQIDKVGNLYGSTQGGGTHGCGTLFKLDAAGQETVLSSFPCGPGLAQGATMDSNGNFYGVYAKFATGSASYGVYKLSLVK